MRRTIVVGKSLLENGYSTVMPNLRHWRRILEMVRDANGLPWTAYPLCMHYMFRLDDRAILTAQEVGLIKTASISTMPVRRKATFKNAMESQVSYERAFEKDFGARFADLRIMHIE